MNPAHASRSNGWAQAQQVFLAGCGLPQAWSGQRQWCVLETDFGLGTNFLATWWAWQQDPTAPGLLHYVAVLAKPLAATDVLQASQDHPELQTLAQALAAQWPSAAPGCQRLRLVHGRVLLTLCLGALQPTLAQLHCQADAVYLHASAAPVLKTLARRCHRGTTLATDSADPPLRLQLAQAGFGAVGPLPAPNAESGWQAQFDPAWEPKVGSSHQPQPWPHAPTHCVVIGAGLAGASVAAALALRGWQVTVLDRGSQPGAGASGLPAGLVVPHGSADDSVLSRLTRHGIRATWAKVQQCLQPDQDYALTGVLERDPDANPRLPSEQWPSQWHADAGWLKPVRLIHALLAQPDVRWQGEATVQRVQRVHDQWLVYDAQQQLLAQAPLLVICAGFDSLALLPQAATLPLQALRGQLSWGWRQAGDAAAFPPTPVNGLGNFIPAVPTPQGVAWYLGSSFVRDDTDNTERASEHAQNLERLAQLLPATAQALTPKLAQGQVLSFNATRCAAPDRLPVVGPVDETQYPGLWVSTAMGARGLSLALLCAELLAAYLHAEPLPLDQRLAQSLGSGRRALRRAQAAQTPAR